jgi:hypothetical protein
MMSIAKNIFIAASLILAICAADRAFAHGEKPKHGGVLQEVSDKQYELVATPTLITIYVEDHGKKVDTKGATAKVTFLNGTEKSQAVLTPAGENKLEAKGAFNVKPGTKAVAVVTLAGKSGVTSRFVVQ